MPAPQVVGRAGDVAPWVTTYYVPPAGEGPNILAQFWAGFNASRNPDAEMLFRLRLENMSPAGKEAAMQKLLALDADLAAKAAESRRYSMEFQSKWDENQVNHEKNLATLGAAQLDADARVAAAHYGYAAEELKDTRLGTDTQKALNDFDDAVSNAKTAIAQAKASHDPAAIQDAANQLTVANHDYVTTARKYANSGPEYGRLGMEQATLLDSVLRTSGLTPDEKKTLQAGLTYLPPAEKGEDPHYGARSVTLPPLDLRGNDGGFSVSQGRSGGGGVSGSVPSTGAGPGMSLPGAFPGGAGASMVFGDDPAQSAIQSARDRLAQQMDQVMADWGSNPYGDLGTPLLTRAPRGPRMPGEERVAPPAPAPRAPTTTSTPTPAQPSAAAPPSSLAERFDRADAAGGSGTTKTSSSTSTSSSRPAAPPVVAPSFLSAVTSFQDAFAKARADRQAAAEPHAEEDDRWERLPPKPKTIVDWSKGPITPTMELPEEEVHGNRPPDPRPTIDDLPDRKSASYARPGDRPNPAAPLELPEMEIAGPTLFDTYNARARGGVPVEQVPWGSTGKPIVVDQDYAWTRDELDPDALARIDARRAVDDFQNLNDEPTQQSIADAYAKRKREARAPQ